MSPIAIIPTALAQAAAAGNPRNRATCGIDHIAGRLGHAGRGDAYICRQIDGLRAVAGFPAPLPLIRAGALVAATHKDHRWQVVAIDTWFDDQLPPAARGALDQAERAAIDSRLSASAALLFAGDAA